MFSANFFVSLAYSTSATGYIYFYLFPSWKLSNSICPHVYASLYASFTFFVFSLFEFPRIIYMIYLAYIACKKMSIAENVVYQALRIVSAL